MDLPEYLCVISWLSCVSIRHTQACRTSIISVCLSVYAEVTFFLVKINYTLLWLFFVLSVSVSACYCMLFYTLASCPAMRNTWVPVEVNRTWCWKILKVRDNGNKIKIHSCLKRWQVTIFANFLFQTKRNSKINKYAYLVTMCFQLRCCENSHEVSCHTALVPPCSAICFS